MQFRSCYYRTKNIYTKQSYAYWQQVIIVGKYEFKSGSRITFHVQFWEHNRWENFAQIDGDQGKSSFWTVLFLNRITDFSFKCVVLKII